MKFQITKALLALTTTLGLQARASLISGTCKPVDPSFNLSLGINNIPDVFPLVLTVGNQEIELISQDNLSRYQSADQKWKFELNKPNSSFCGGGRLTTPENEVIDFKCQFAIGCHN